MTISTNTLQTDIDRESARSAYHGTSFSPEKRGDSVVDSYIATMQELAQFITVNAKDARQQAVMQEVFDNLKDKYKAKTLASLSAQSRCLSTMIAGSANFPVRRAEKANESERKRSDEWLEFHNNLEKYALKNLDAVYTTAEKQSTELENYRQKVKDAEQRQLNMRAVNKAHKAFSKDPDSATTIKLMGELSEVLQREVKTYVPSYSWEPHPFAPCQLNNNNANLKRMRIQLSMLEKKGEAREQAPEQDRQLNNLIVRRNFTEDRLQLLFDDKPGSETRAMLKSSGFRWSPRFTAWQRKLTNNALYAVRRLLNEEAMQQYNKE